MTGAIGPAAAPAALAPGPAQRRDVFLKRRQLRRHREIGIERKRGAVKYKFVLPADLVEIDKRKPALGDPRHRNRQADVVLVARVGRTVRHNENFRAGLGETFDDVLVIFRLFQPGILADRHPDPHAADRHRTRGGPPREHALFIEHAVIRQVDLEPDGSDPAFVEKRTGIVELAVLDPGSADQQRRAAVGGFPREFLDRGTAGRLKCRLQDQVFRRIAGNEQFRQNDQVGAIGASLRARGACLDGIARDIPHRRVQLGQRDRKLRGAFGH